ncbi:MAG: hypothetical protein AB8G05_17120 [Oligoflexales bacterium]
MEVSNEKIQLLGLIIKSLETEFAAIIKSAESAYQGATHEDAVSKSKYETHGLELSYLAGSQFERARVLKQQIMSLSNKVFKTFKNSDEIAAEALVTMQASENRKYHYLVYSLGAGLKLDLLGKTIQVISPQSAIGNELIGAFLDDDIFIERGNKVEEWKVVAIQ